MLYDMLFLKNEQLIRTQDVRDKKRINPNLQGGSDLSNVAPQVRLELTTLRLTAACSTD